jgi:replicative DNA helicase
VGSVKLAGSHHPTGQAASLEELAMKKEPKTPDEVRIPPQDNDTEQEILGGALCSSDACAHMIGSLTEDDFGNVYHQRIFRAIESEYEKEPEGVNVASVGFELKRRETLADCGGAEYIERLRGEYVHMTSLRQGCIRLRELATLRETMKIGGRMYSEAEAIPDDIHAFLAENMALVTALAERNAPQFAFATFEEIGEGMTDTTWLWKHWLPNGYLTLLAGDPGVGKSMLSLHLARSVALPCAWPDGTPGPDEPGTVLYCDTEAAQAMHVQRARRWGIPMDRLLMPGLDGTGHLWLDDPESLLAVRDAVAKHGVRLVIVDSLRAGFKGDENSSEVAEMMTEWAALARDLEVAMVFVHHMRKRQQGEKREATLEALRGSSAIGAAARSVIALDCPDPRDTAIRAAVVKTNLCPKPEPIGLTVSEDGISGAQAPSAPRPDTKLAEAEDFLTDQLRHGAKSPGDLIDMAEEQGIARATLYRAKESLDLVSMDHDDDPRKSMWGLPARRSG